MTPTDEGVTFEQANEVLRLYYEDFLSEVQISKVTRHDEKVIERILNGRIFPGALRAWEKKE